MATIRMEGMSSRDPLRLDLGHEARHEGTIAEVSDVYVRDSDYGEKEQLTISIRSDIDDDLDIDDEDREDLKEYIEQKNEELSSEEEEYSTEYVELPFFPTAKLTRGGGSVNNSKLFNTLEKLGLVEPVGDDRFKLLNRHGKEVNPFEGKETNEELNEALTNYLRNNLTGMEIEYELRNVNRGEDNEYSVVGKVIDLVHDPETEESDSPIVEE